MAGVQGGGGDAGVGGWTKERPRAKRMGEELAVTREHEPSLERQDGGR